ncbi:carbohydrate binding domain-containing protein [Cellulomonas sp. S1-8]|uniref:carbohydrate binding domain-containing protein n=1 Tax=Cellulomonas sp. S1-8 TaxID=2904790 RepID=UPI002242FCF4|nr:carbohydrate binding domain-containing protein [Cellulomonas sp. S1-8]UZN04354.1 family 16 glycosylhydrolase [Cellulomonas sp. S1-8]
MHPLTGPRTPSRPSAAAPRPRRAAALAALTALLAGTVALAAPTASVAADDVVDLVHDFESGDTGPGYIQWANAGSGVRAVPGDGLPARPDGAASAHALSYGFDTATDPFYGGIGWEYADAPRDFSGYDGVQLWVYGDGSGATFQVELLDATGPGAGPYERFDVTVPVGEAGWRQVRLAWTDFARATDFQDTGAPADGLGLTHVRGLLLPAASGTATVVVDDLAVYSTDGPVTPSVGVGSAAVGVTESAGAAEVAVRLSTASADEVTVGYATADGTALAGTHYTATSGTLTFPAGTTTLTVPVTVADDDVPGPNRTFTLTLTDPVGATLGLATATVTIRDDDAAPSTGTSLLHRVVDGFEEPLVLGDPAAAPPLGWFTAQGAGNVPEFARSTTPPTPVPGASDGNSVLRLGLDNASWAALLHTFTDDGTTWQTQDWSDYRGLGFWLHGANSGAQLFVDVLDNRNLGSTVDDAERFSTRLVDDWNGWRFVEIPFADLLRKNVNNGAPDDGLGLTEVHGLAIGIEQTAARATPVLWLDDLALVEHQDVVLDFEQPLVTGSTATPPVGWVTASGAGNDPVLDRVTTAPAGTRPGAADGNHVLALGMTNPSWAVAVHNFTTDGTTWTPQDWSAATTLSFWFHGANTGARFDVDVLDNRNPGSTVDDAERFTASFTDDTTGWRRVVVPFADLVRKGGGQPSTAPDDGLTLTAVHGFALAIQGSPPSVDATFHVDDVTVSGASLVRNPVRVRLAQAIVPVTEGESAQVAVALTRVSEQDVTVAWRTEEIVERTSEAAALRARDGRDFASASGTVTIPAGERQAVVEVATLDDAKPEYDEPFAIALSDPEGAQPGEPLVGQVVVEDDDVRDPLMIEDVEDGIGLLEPLGPAALEAREVEAGTDEAYPGADTYEHVLDVLGDGGFRRGFAQPQDWSATEGLSMWFHGRGDGRPVTVTVEDDATADPGPQDWELAWSDEFDGAAGTPADPSRWTYETGGWGWGNDELQYYTDSTDNAAHDGAGNLVITTREVDPETSGLSCWYGPCTHTSARLITEGKAEFQHGRIEARAKLPQGAAGIWPAFWSLGTDFRDVGWPQTGEIDVMEYVGKLPEEIFGTIHGPGYSGGDAFGSTHDFGRNLGGEWMTFAVEWEPEEIRWYVTEDGGEPIHFHTATPADVAPDSWVFEHPFNLIANMAVGGNFGGPLAEDLTFPQQLVFDHVRVYQAPDTAERFTAEFVDDTAGWRQVVLPFDDFERGAQQPAGAPDDGLTLTGVRGLTVATAGAGAGPAGPVALALPHDGVALDRVALVADLDEGPGGGTDGPGGGGPGSGGTGSGVGGASGGSGTPTGGLDGRLAATGASVPILLGIALALLLTGAELVRRRRRA